MVVAHGFHVTQVPRAEHSSTFCHMGTNCLPLPQKVFTIPLTKAAHGFHVTRGHLAEFFTTLLMEVENSLLTPTRACIIQPIAEGHGLREDKTEKYFQS